MGKRPKSKKSQSVFDIQNNVADFPIDLKSSAKGLERVDVKDHFNIKRNVSFKGSYTVLKDSIFMGFMRDGQRLVGNRFFDEKLVGNRTPNFFEL